MLSRRATDRSNPTQRLEGEAALSRVIRWLCLAPLLILCCAPTAHALGPHELLLLSNARSPDSMRVADAFARLRGVPDVNRVALDLPESWPAHPMDVSPSDFERHIFSPASAAARERGIDGHVLAWVYSVDFPTRVTTTPATSLTGATFVRGRFPPAREIEDGRYASPLFAGPHGRRGTAHFSQSLDVSRAWLAGEMPLPAMMLGYTGPRGNSIEQVLACLAHGARAGESAPQGVVFFITSDDVRSRCREWQFLPAVEELRARGIAAEILPSIPTGEVTAVGLTLGTAVLPPTPSLRLAPGALAEHLTSFAAVFEDGGQTKLTEWIARGAAASCGTVTEPRSIWTKFPNARLHVHYAAGCTAIESFYQAVRSPLQLLIVGDPLAAPYARPDCRARLRGLTDSPAAGMLRVELLLDGTDAERFLQFAFWLNGRPAGGDRVVWLDTDELQPGSTNRLRAVAYETGFVRRQVWAEGSFTVAGRQQVSVKH